MLNFKVIVQASVFSDSAWFQLNYIMSQTAAKSYKKIHDKYNIYVFCQT